MKFLAPRAVLGLAVVALLIGGVAMVARRGNAADEVKPADAVSKSNPPQAGRKPWTTSTITGSPEAPPP